MFEPEDLVLHQRYERGDDDGEAVGVDGGVLVTQALAVARGHHDALVSPVDEDVAYDAPLARAELVVAERRLELGQVVGRGARNWQGLGLGLAHLGGPRRGQRVVVFDDERAAGRVLALSICLGGE